MVKERRVEGGEREEGESWQNREGWQRRPVYRRSRTINRGSVGMVCYGKVKERKVPKKERGDRTLKR